MQEHPPDRGFLASLTPLRAILVEFQYNPTQVDDKRGLAYATLAAPGLIVPLRQYSHGGDRTISFTVRVDGTAPGPAGQKVAIKRDTDGGIEPELNKYRAFVYPFTERWETAKASFLPLYKGVQTFVAPPSAQLGLGQRVIDCVVTDIAITELLFNERLSPLRADVAVTICELNPVNAGGG